MVTSVEEETTIMNNSDNSLPVTRIIMGKVKSVIGFFSMTKEEMLRANIDLHGYYEGDNQDKP